jgi:hypothetical protein
MNGFNTWERLLARMLERFPLARMVVKESYKRIIYLRHRKRGFEYKLHPQVVSITPHSWAGIPMAPGEWFFGYYDKSPWSPDMTKMLLHHRRGNRVEIILFDAVNHEQRMIGHSEVWTWQQGAMAQWVMSDRKMPVVYNTINNGTLGCQITENTGHQRTFIPWPIQTLHPQRCEALSLNYRRLAAMRPCYGYTVRVNNFSRHQRLDKDGIWRVDLVKGTSTLIVSLAALSSLYPVASMRNAQHKVNHCIYSPSGNAFVFLHRYIGKQGKFSRLYVANANGELKLLMDDRIVSHYHWDGEDHLIVWGRTVADGDRYYRINVKNGGISKIGNDSLDSFGDGHCSVSPDKRWIITDTYPNKARDRHLLLYDTANQQCTVVGHFFSPWRFNEQKRCDLHPRWSWDGNWLSIDSAHEGIRRNYLLKVSSITRGASEISIPFSR